MDCYRRLLSVDYRKIPVNMMSEYSSLCTRASCMDNARRRGELTPFEYSLHTDIDDFVRRIGM